MKTHIVLCILLSFVSAYSEEACPNDQAFLEAGWIIHCDGDFEHILQQKLNEFRLEVGRDLILDDAECYKSDFSHDYYLIMRVVIWDRVSTGRDEMWGDVAFSMTGPYSADYIEVRWYDPITKKKHIVFNPKYACCLTTKVPLAYNTIF
ncbi:MAG: hypothetical protein WBB23_03400 [Desulforhopalus sp.]